MTPARPQSKPHSCLRLPRSQAKDRIAAQIDAGQELLRALDGQPSTLNRIEREHRKWDSKNKTMLRGLFDPYDQVLEDYERATPPAIGLRPTARGYVPPPPGQREKRLRNAIQGQVDALDVVKDTLQYCKQPEAAPQASPVERAGSVSRDVFIVHGHDEAAKESVARFIQKLELKPIILHEQPDKGRTIIEKFEDYSDVGYAVVLLTPDDVCAPQSKPEERQPRPRQNVVFELGFFVGKLGREKVCVLYKKGVEMPSDYQGVIYKEMDDGGWQLEVAKEMRAAGLDVDLNLL